MIYYYLASLLLTLTATAVILRFLIPYLKSRKMGQKILDIGPRWHKSKEGTPTMGGLSFLIAILTVSVTLLLIAAGNGDDQGLVGVIITLAFAALNAGIGIIDDRTKFSKGKNEGLLSWQKYLLQLLVCGLYLAALHFFCDLSTELYLPFVKSSVSLGILYWPFAVLLITGIVNSVNLTDGIDGLAASETAIVAAFFSVVAFFFDTLSLGIIAGATVGGCLGFLVYNFYPARVFMGDTGSLFLGALVVGMGFLSGNPLILLVVGFMYLLEAISDIIQVLYFKLTHGKRFFKMAPIHHHFEKCGWSEIKIVSVFSLITVLFCAVSLLFDLF